MLREDLLTRCDVRVHLGGEIDMSDFKQTQFDQYLYKPYTTIY